MRPRALFLAVVLLVSVAACGSDPDIETNGSAPAPTLPAGFDLSDETFVPLEAGAAEVDAHDNTFVAPYVEIHVGDTLTFGNTGHNEHNVIPVIDGSFTPIETAAFEPGTTREVTFDQAGTFPYYCSLHGTTTKGMVGAVRVVE